MFKKTLLALALTGLAGTATAATIDTTAGTGFNDLVSFSAEGIAKVGVVDLDLAVNGTTKTGAVELKVEKAFSVGDTLVFTFPNDKFAVGTDAEVFAGAGTGAGTGNEKFADLVTSTTYAGGNKVSFVLKAAVAANDTVTLTGIKLDTANLLAGGKVAVAFNGVSKITSGSFDPLKSTVIADAKTELKASIGANDYLGSAKVDVSKDRLVFVGGGKTDTLKLTAGPVAGLKEGVTVKKTVYTLNGDFSFLDTDADGKADYSVTPDSGTLKVAKDFQSITLEEAAFDGVTFTIEATDGTTVIPVQDFTVNALVTYEIDDANGSAVTETKDFSLYAGSWVLNGFAERVDFLPFGSQYAQSVTVTNTGTVEGAITISMTANGETKSKRLDSVAKARSVTNIGKEVAAFAQELGVNGDASFVIIVDAPSTQIKANAVYYSKADKDRVLTK